jgi:hypothetical protein
LVIVRLERREIEKERRSMPSTPTLKRSGDQVAQTADLQHILGREEPVVAGQAHSTADRDRLAQQPGANLPGKGRWQWRGEEQPGMRPEARARCLQRDRRPSGAGGLHVRQRIEHRRRAVEIGGQPPATVAIEQRVQADLLLAGQVCGQHFGC